MKSLKSDAWSAIALASDLLLDLATRLNDWADEKARASMREWLAEVIGPQVEVN